MQSCLHYINLAKLIESLRHFVKTPYKLEDRKKNVFFFNKDVDGAK